MPVKVARVFYVRSQNIKSPSPFGSHDEMVTRKQGNKVWCEDSKGEYQTTKDRLDNGLADPNRYDR